jgi:hypothetical protein
MVLTGALIRATSLASSAGVAGWLAPGAGCAMAAGAP